MANYLDRFDEFINNKDAKGASDLMYSIIEEEYRAKNSGKYDAERFGAMADAVDQFIIKITDQATNSTEVKEEYKEFLLAFIDQVTEKYLSAVVPVGRKIDEWEKKIR